MAEKPSLFAMSYLLTLSKGSPGFLEQIPLFNDSNSEAVDPKTDVGVRGGGPGGGRRMFFSRREYDAHRIVHRMGQQDAIFDGPPLLVSADMLFLTGKLAQQCIVDLPVQFEGDILNY